MGIIGYWAKAIILAIGGKVSQTEFKYDYYLNKGLSYCAVCDGFFYRKKKTGLVGSGDYILPSDIFGTTEKK